MAQGNVLKVINKNYRHSKFILKFSISLQKQLSIRRNRIESTERYRMGYFGFHFLFSSSLVKKKVENYVGDDVYTKIN